MRLIIDGLQISSFNGNIKSTSSTQVQIQMGKRTF